MLATWQIALQLALMLMMQFTHYAHNFSVSFQIAQVFLDLLC